MQINPEIKPILRHYNINVDQGLLFLLGVYFDLDVNTICVEEVIKQINLTKIVEKDYTNGTIKWNIPLFAGQETAFDWVGDWLEPFGAMNLDRRGSVRDAISRMKKFFAKYPEYRKEDIYAARDMYLRTITKVQFLMKSHKFIFDGIGAMEKSTLLEYCEKVRGSSNPNESNQKGKIIK